MSRDPSQETVALTLHVPRSALIQVAAPPELVSQRTALCVLGVPPRAFLELLREERCPLEVLRVGKLRLVKREALVSWLRAREAKPEKAPASAPADPADAVMAELGLRKVGT